MINRSVPGVAQLNQDDKVPDANNGTKTKISLTKSNANQTSAAGGDKTKTATQVKMG